jgi:acetyl esterase/lipase
MKVFLSISFAVAVLLFPLLLESCSHPTPEGKAEPVADPVAAIASEISVVSDVKYGEAAGRSLLLDAYVPAVQLGEDPWTEYTAGYKPTLLYFHGGGWSQGDKVSRSLLVLPYLQKGWCVVNADYRLLDSATNVMDCVRDSRAALKWIYDNAQKYRFDTTRIVVSGESSGGHLALMTGMAVNGDTFAEEPGSRPLRVAAIVNWFGITDVGAAVKFWKSEEFAQKIVGRNPDRETFYKTVSPVTHVGQNSPPVLTVHGDADVSVPLEQANLLHTALQKHGVKNKLIIIPGKKHGNFSGPDLTRAFGEIWQFLQIK